MYLKEDAFDHKNDACHSVIAHLTGAVVGWFPIVQWRQFFANSILGKILRKTSNLGNNFAEDDITGKNLQNIMGFG